MFPELQNFHWFFILLVVAVVAFLTWCVNRLETNNTHHIARTTALYDEQLEATKALYNESNLLRKQMLSELQDIRKLLGSRNN